MQKNVISLCYYHYSCCVDVYSHRIRMNSTTFKSGVQEIKLDTAAIH